MSRTRTDGNQKEIIEKWMKIPGASYVDLHNVRNGCPDLLLGYGGLNFLFEIKNKGGKMTPKQGEFFISHTGHRSVVYGFDQILQEVGRTLYYLRNGNYFVRFQRYAKQIYKIDVNVMFLC